MHEGTPAAPPLEATPQRPCPPPLQRLRVRRHTRRPALSGGFIPGVLTGGLTWLVDSFFMNHLPPFFLFHVRYNIGITFTEYVMHEKLVDLTEVLRTPILRMKHNFVRLA